MLLDIHNPYRTPQGSQSTSILRSRLHPYLRVKLRQDSSAYGLNLSRSSICAITWNYYSWLKSARSRLHDKIASKRIGQDLNEEATEEEA